MTSPGPPEMGPSLHPSVLGLTAAILLVEALLWATDPRLRYTVFSHLAVGAVPPSTATRFSEALPWFLGGLVGHAFLHAGWLHVTFNAVGLLCLGHVVQAQAGMAAFFVAFLTTAVAGAAAFLLLWDEGIMVGASGGVFGLLGIVLRWRRPPVALWRVLLVLALLTVPAGLLMGGPIAWQAHLGGFLAGWALGRLLPIRRRIVHPLM